MFEILAARWNLLVKNPSICINLSNMLIYGIICKWRDINNPLLIKLMQNLHFMKTCWSMIEAKLSAGDDDEEDKATKRRWVDSQRKKIISFYNLEDNTSSCYYRSSAEIHKKSLLIYFLIFHFKSNANFIHKLKKKEKKPASHKSCFCESNLFGQLFGAAKTDMRKIDTGNKFKPNDVNNWCSFHNIWRFEIRNDINFF